MGYVASALGGIQPYELKMGDEKRFKFGSGCEKRSVEPCYKSAPKMLKVGWHSLLFLFVLFLGYFFLLKREIRPIGKITYCCNDYYYQSSFSKQLVYHFVKIELHLDTRKLDQWTLVGSQSVIREWQLDHLESNAWYWIGNGKAMRGWKMKAWRIPDVGEKWSN